MRNHVGVRLLSQAFRYHFPRSTFNPRSTLPRFLHGRSLRSEAPATIPLPAINIDFNGNTTPQHVQKADIASDMKLMIRDLRCVDPTFRSSPSAILARHNAIVIHLEYLRVVILNNRVLVFDPRNPAVERFIPELRKRIASVTHPMPFELR